VPVKKADQHTTTHQPTASQLARLIINSTPPKIIIELLLAITKSVTIQGADKSLARPGRKQATFPAFYGTWRFITTSRTVHHLSLP